MCKNLILLGVIISLSGCFGGTEYELEKFYKDPLSPAAIMMGGTYAGVVQTFNSLDGCLQMKKQVEHDDRESGYSNSRFVCDEK